eukprot:TCONS_00046536-protein
MDAEKLRKRQLKREREHKQKHKSGKRELPDEKAEKQMYEMNVPERGVVISNVSTLFNLDEEICDVTVLTYESPKEVLKLPSKYVNFISEKLKTLVAEETGEIDVTSLDVSIESIEQAISFYHPKNSIKLEDESPFEELLTLCDEWNLLAFRTSIEEYFIEHHQYGCNYFDGDVGPEHIKLFYILEKFNFGNIINMFVEDCCISDDVIKNYKECGLEKLSKELQYEMLKVEILDMLEVKSNRSELHTILNFFNFLVHEDRVVDQYAKNGYKKQIEYGIYEEIKQSDFEEKRFGADVTIIVSDTKLYVNSQILMDNSPVFKRRLENLGDKELVLELPWKNTKEVVLFFTFLTKPCKIERDVDLYALASICQEYQVQWIIDKIGNYISTKVKFGGETYQSLLRFLKLACMIKKEDVVKKLIQILDQPFQLLKMTEEFTWLNTSAKILVARKCLFTLAEESFNESEASLPANRVKFNLLMNEDGCGLLNILQEYSQIEFDFQNDNDEEEKDD